ncbi:FCS-Like Zinc finger 17-like isoform X2 [Hibiscus syriacus]|uniref:FCS-Like Zinc finger 17-like isoform X2 n=1 Tax=Hibiscus syriacus TaxID=106335 RepID=UPI0019239DAC|nr:FCS-Like Zinc finger 17-like isoform X2 [Hibiscus syriacus]
MTPKLRSPFKQLKRDSEGEEGKKNNPVYANFCKSSSVVVGLRILTQIPQGKKSVVVVKPALKISLPTASSKHRLANQDSCFLKSCYLCSKNLSLDKEVFMYRILKK